MSSINDILSSARSALLAQQVGMQITGSNIANAQNPNYSRRLLSMSSTINSGNSYLGTGVELASIQRGRDQIIDIGIWREKASFGYFESSNKFTTFVESVFNDLSGTGLSQNLDEFWNSWLELSNHPEDAGARLSVVSKSRKLADKLNNMDTQLRSIANQSQIELESKVNRVNFILQNIANINRQINRGSSGVGINNSLLDKRDSLIDELSSYIDLQVVFNEGGSVNIYGSNQILVETTKVFELNVKTRNQNGQKEVYLTLYNDVEINVKNGSLKSLIDQSNQSDELKALDDIAKNLVEQVNSIHKTLYNLKGETGLDFFESTSITAGGIQLQPEILKNGSNIAVSKDSQRGDGSGSLDIANIRRKKILSGGTLTIDESYRAIVSLVGQRSREAVDSFETQTEVVTALQNQRQAIMGVSLEEEMINLIKYQNAFASASQLVSTLDEMYQTIIDMV